MKVIPKLLSALLASAIMITSSVTFISSAEAEEIASVRVNTETQAAVPQSAAASASQPDENSEIVEGYTEGSVSWTLDTEGTLRVDAVNIPDYDEDFTSWEVVLSPWFHNGNQVKTIILSENVRYIGSYAFNTCVVARNIIIPDTVEFIAANAFENVPVYENAPVENGIKYYKNVLISADASGSCNVKEGTTCMVNGAFREETALTEITLPQTLNSIGKYAFYDCTALSKVNIPSSAVKIGSYAFYNCPALTSISLSPNTVEIQNSAFSGTSITGISLPDTLTSIQNNAFANTKLESVIIPDSVTSIGSMAFANCTELNTVKLSKNLISAEKDIFDNSPCVENIGGVLYADTLLLKPEAELSDNYTVREGTLYIARNAFEGSTQLNEVIFPESLQYIGESAFLGCSSLTRSVIPDNVSLIEETAFYNCTALNYIELPSSITRIYRSTFGNCTSLSALDIPDGVTHIEDSLSGVTLEEITLPSTLVYIAKQWNFNYGIKRVYISDLTAYCNIKYGNYYDLDAPHSLLYNAEALYVNGELLEDLVVPEGITVLERNFEGYKALRTVTLPKSLTEVGGFAFKDCLNLETVNFNSGCKIGKYAFSNCDSIVKIDLKKGVCALGDYAFSNCSSLLNLTIPDTVTEMGEYVFQNCGNLNRVTFNSPIKEIPVGTFKNSGIPSFTIPEWVERIEREAFSQTKNLTSIIVPDSVIYVGYNAFTDSKAITRNEGFVRVENILISSTLTTETVCVPSDITVIAVTAFSEKKQKSIILPEGLTGISQRAFKDCKKLESVKLPTTLKVIGDEAFYGCTKLSDIVIPDSVTTFGKLCFGNCTSLTTFILPASAENVGNSIISGCSALESIYIYDINIWLNACKNQFYPSSADNVDFYYNGELLKEITVEGRKELPDYSFAHCASLETVTLSSDVTSIGMGAFNGCKNLKYINIPNSVTKIDTYFAGSDQMKLRCHTNSYAHKFALENNIKYELIDGTAYTYPDVSPNAWYAEGVKYCSERGLLIGTNKGTFEPNSELTREQFVLILARYAKFTPSVYRISLFDDVKSEAWYGPAVIWAYENGYIKGVGNGNNFGVGKPISREELAVIFMRFAVSKGINTTERGDLSQFKDGAMVSSWAKEAVAWTVSTRLLGSTSTNEMILAPQMTVTRAQAAKIFMNFSK